MPINLLRKITKKLILIFEEQYLSILCQLQNSNIETHHDKKTYQLISLLKQDQSRISVFDAHFSKVYNLEKKKRTIRRFNVSSHSQNIYRKNLFAIDEETGFCPDWKVREEEMNILPEESCVTLRNSMVCSTSKNWKINSLSQSFLKLAPQYPDIRILWMKFVDIYIYV